MQVAYKTVAQEFLDENDGNPIFAAAALALALMKGDPANFKLGYTKENAVFAAVDAIELEADDGPIDKAIVTSAVDVALKNQEA